MIEKSARLPWAERTVSPSSLVIRHSSLRGVAAFTVLEMLIVMSIIVVLAALVFGTYGFIQKKGARSRAESEIAAMSAALETYKADNGTYARDPTITDALDARTSTNPTSYQAASLFLYKTLSGDANADLKPPATAKTYFSFKPQMLFGPKDSNGNLTSVTYIRDPFGNSYGYSTAYAADVEKNPTGTSRPGYNPTFDLWSTAGGKSAAEWIKNW